LPGAPLVAIIDADGFLAFPDFKAEEQLLQTLARARSLAKRSPLVIQTFRPEEKSLLAFVAGTAAAHLREIGAERETLGFPPFGRLLRIEVLRDTAEAALKDARRIKEELSIALGDTKKTIVADTGKSYQVRKKFQALVLAKLPADAFPLPQSTASYLRTLPRDTYPDVDPLSFY
jgi:primosomal protein N' (replication factor Y)